MQSVGTIQLAQRPPTPGEKDNTTERPMVLIIEDQPPIRELLSTALTLYGYQPVCAANGQEALVWITDALQTEHYPVAILLGLLMPVMNGAGFLATLRTWWDAPVAIPPVILLSADKNDYSSLGCDDVLIKPFRMRDLCERLRLLANLASL